MKVLQKRYKKEIINDFTSLCSAPTKIKFEKKVKEKIVQYLLADRMSNYGYDYQT